MGQGISVGACKAEGGTSKGKGREGAEQTRMYAVRVHRCIPEIDFSRGSFSHSYVKYMGAWRGWARV